MDLYNVMFGIVICVICTVYGTDAKVLLISMDGFRWDYINQVDTPNFDEFARLGTRAEYINNTFITKTFPCHYAIATGLYEESHGIIANHMWDSVRKKMFGMGSKESYWWDGGEPLWVTVQRHGLKSAVYYWPGSEAKIRGKYANIYRPYVESVPFEDRIETVFSWLTGTGEQNIDLAMLYFHEPDHTGHVYGPKSSQVRDKVAEMDAVLGKIMDKMTENKLWDSVNVLVTSDHGMTGVDDLTKVDSTTRGIDLTQHINVDDIEVMPGGGPVVSILPKAGKEDTMFTGLSGVPHMTVYKKEDIPDHWHYKNNDRILPLLLVADEGWLIEKNLSESKERSLGTHGYDNRLSSMKPIFYARGPNIKPGHVSDPFKSVDIYPLVCKLLGIQGADVNGTLDITKEFIVESTPGSTMTSPVTMETTSGSTMTSPGTTKRVTVEATTTSGSAMTSWSIWMIAFSFLCVSKSMLKTH